MTRRTIIAANWKMNGGLTLVNEMAEMLSSIQLKANSSVVVCPTFPYLQSMVSNLDNSLIKVGAQNMSEYRNGAFTGEVSGEMLKELSVDYVILGHSERRSLNKETSTLIAHKVQLALELGITPILCIGESELERVSGETETVLASQLQPVIDLVGINKFKDVVIAYEPVWAIGTGKTASPEMAQETHKYIRHFVAEINENIAEKIPLLYGGSVNATNCKELFEQPDIDGGLVGGAALNAAEFSKICQSA